MAMVGNDLGDAIKNAIDSVSDKTDREEIFRAIGTAIVNYITTNGTIDLTALFTLGTPVPNDGGAALKATWASAGAQSSVIR